MRNSFFRLLPKDLQQKQENQLVWMIVKVKGSYFLKPSSIYPRTQFKQDLT